MGERRVDGGTADEVNLTGHEMGVAFPCGGRLWLKESTVSGVLLGFFLVASRWLLVWCRGRFNWRWKRVGSNNIFVWVVGNGVCC